jgi:hypothetical protein
LYFGFHVVQIALWCSKCCSFQAFIEVFGLTVGTIVVVNAVGDTIDPGTARPAAGVRTEDGRGLLDAWRATAAGHVPKRVRVGTNTTISGRHRRPARQGPDVKGP